MTFLSRVVLYNWDVYGMRHVQTSEPRSGDRHRPLITLAAIMCAVSIAACGSSSASRSAAGSSPTAPGIRFADCMRAHGLSNFPDPSGGGGGIHIQAGSGINPQSPEFQSAQKACSSLLPGGGPGSQHPSEREKAQMLQISQCMRRHGVSGFPDPTLTPPSSPAGYAELQDRGGVILAIPNTINTASPAYNQAAAACGFAH